MLDVIDKTDNSILFEDTYCMWYLPTHMRQDRILQNQKHVSCMLVTGLFWGFFIYLFISVFSAHEWIFYFFFNGFWFTCVFVSFVFACLWVYRLNVCVVHLWNYFFLHLQSKAEQGRDVTFLDWQLLPHLLTLTTTATPVDADYNRHTCSHWRLLPHLLTLTTTATPVDTVGGGGGGVGGLRKRMHVCNLSIYIYIYI